ncbi:MAG: DUF3108 domain-containing protein [Candidatus Omnitrophota bacterium]|nr:MAG: DUF3108 domain-containing protein [Candidatus Omnitrophota bacterium]
MPKEARKGGELMRRIIFAIFALAIAMFLLSSKMNNDPAAILSALSKKNASGSTELKYKLYLLGVVPAGEALLTDKGEVEFNGKKVYHLHAVAESSRIFSLFFHGRAQMDSYIDPATMLPVAFMQKISLSGKPDTEKEVTYDQVHNVMTSAGIKREILPRTHDALSLVFSLRSVDFSATDTIEFNVNTNQKNYILSGNAQKKELPVNHGIIEVVQAKVQIKRRDGNPYHQSSVEMFVWEANKKIPFLIKISANGIPITVKLVEAR